MKIMEIECLECKRNFFMHTNDECIKFCSYCSSENINIFDAELSFIRQNNNVESYKTNNDDKKLDINELMEKADAELIMI